ncbi:MAG TPA: LemA family protein [Tenericutes bacterium]|nr:LemA family protein [Mycoplasmatota bacterium]
MKLGLIIFLVVVFLIVMYVISTYNLLVRLRNMVKDQWAQIDVLIKRRADLIPNLVETVKGYAKHEKDTFEAVISARNKAMSATTTESEMEANGELTQALGRLFAIAEAYPELKANTNFQDLQNNLKETEDKISFARQFYNDAVLSYKNKLEMFPSNIVANLFNFKSEPFFEATGTDREVPKVQF